MPDYPPLSTQVIGQAESALGALLDTLLDETAITFGQRLFPAGSPPAYVECLSAGQVGAAVLARYGRAAR
jgi:hypothetical protein